MTTHTLVVDLLGYWHPGGGRGGAVADAAVHRDAAGLPVLPGKHLKGLLRDALERAESFGWVDYAGMAQALFGERTENLADQHVPRPGSLRIADARLPEEIADWLANSKNGRVLIPGLFRTLHSTAIEHETGTAKNRTLRGMEVVVPLKLKARIEPVPGYDPPSDWPAIIGGILPLVDAVGAQRTRGLGRVVLAWEKAA